MSLDYYLERFEDEGLKPLADKVRQALPSKAREILKEALEENEKDRQKYMVSQGFGHTKFSMREDIIKGALNEL